MMEYIHKILLNNARTFCNLAEKWPVPSLFNNNKVVFIFSYEGKRYLLFVSLRKFHHSRDYKQKNYLIGKC